MAAKKFAISIPSEVMKEVDRAAAKRRVTRSRFISDVLRRVADAQHDKEITRRIDEVLAEPGLADEQRQTARAFSGLRSKAGTEW
jgi:metal-responsive CopG/Arc/MetJ family transcriptional regulator